VHGGTHPRSLSFLFAFFTSKKRCRGSTLRFHSGVMILDVCVDTRGVSLVRGCRRRGGYRWSRRSWWQCTHGGRTDLGVRGAVPLLDGGAFVSFIRAIRPGLLAPARGTTPGIFDDHGAALPGEAKDDARGGGTLLPAEVGDGVLSMPWAPPPSSAVSPGEASSQGPNASLERQ
jgi:hypothetical protein